MPELANDPNADFDPSNITLFAETKLPNHDTPYDGSELLEWAARLANQAPIAFGWEKSKLD